MRIVIQRVLKASLSVDGKKISSIDKGAVVFLGLKKGDSEEEAKKLAIKLSKLRIFEDENGKMNKNISDYGGEILLVSQFTLYANCRHGNRPSFTDALEPQEAKKLYLIMQQYLQEEDIAVKTGIFGADMKIDVLNAGPVTIILDSSDLR